MTKSVFLTGLSFRFPVAWYIPNYWSSIEIWGRLGAAPCRDASMLLVVWVFSVLASPSVAAERPAQGEAASLESGSSQCAGLKAELSRIQQTMQEAQGALADLDHLVASEWASFWNLDGLGHTQRAISSILTEEVGRLQHLLTTSQRAKDKLLVKSPSDCDPEVVTAWIYIGDPSPCHLSRAPLSCVGSRAAARSLRPGRRQAGQVKSKLGSVQRKSHHARRPSQRPSAQAVTSHDFAETFHTFLFRRIDRDAKMAFRHLAQSSRGGNSLSLLPPGFPNVPQGSEEGEPEPPVGEPQVVADEVGDEAWAALSGKDPAYYPQCINIADESGQDVTLKDFPS
ncbi:hypothetical protein AK812_SmicGene14776 [Symbiodinium microadriaticum]|uniref:Uncharacterized protein n=1 Tax=Symbiodinium microadriaticum TaxID=2951 RepID=A0A1Q9E4N1_SYMMI|nr:hypothetical protein AK812_SmicGene14776 [Symbiodinium microadriaticum]